MIMSNELKTVLAPADVDLTEWLRAELMTGWTPAADPTAVVIDGLTRLEYRMVRVHTPLTP